MRPFFENNVLQQQPFKPMIIVVDTTKAGSASNTFVLPIIKAASETVKIYWGDGTSSIGVNGDNTHVYAASGVYTVKIESRIFGGVYFNNTGDRAKVTSVANFGDGLFRVLAGGFHGCSSLTTVNAHNSKFVSTTAQNAFNGCSSLTAVSINLSNITDASYLFLGNISLLSAKITTSGKLVNTASMFYNCPLLTNVSLFDMSNVTNTTEMFLSNTSIITVPLFDLSKVVTAANMFRSCVNFAIVPPFNLSSCTNATNMFFNCTLTTQSYSNFLINLATLSLKSGVSFHGGNSKYNTAGGVARAYIISNFGWTITDGGAA